RQYVPRALQTGATADEVLDAILHAFPALGLTKIVWAIDILLQMDIPEFRPENLGRRENWHAIMPIEKVPLRQPLRLDVDGRGVFIYRDGDDYRVYDAHCPHQATNIPELALAGLHLTCPKHQWTFDIATGACIDKGNRPLHRFDVKVEHGVLYAH